MSTVIDAERSTVWEALSDPEQVVRWRPGVQDALDPASTFPQPGTRVRWRIRLRELPVTLEELPLVVVPPKRLRSAFTLGLFRFEATFALREVPGLTPRTRLALKVAAPSEMPVVGGALDRFAVRRFATDLTSNYLQAVRDWCESGVVAQTEFPELSLTGTYAAGGGA